MKVHINTYISRNLHRRNPRSGTGNVDDDDNVVNDVSMSRLALCWTKVARPLTLLVVAVTLLSSSSVYTLSSHLISVKQQQASTSAVVMRVETASVVNYSMEEKPRVLSPHEGIQLLQIFRDQVGSCPDYAHIGRGWNYPESRAGYQSSSSRRHASLKQSRDRQARSIRAVDAAINSLETSVVASSADVVRVIGNLILDEAGFHSNAAIRAHASWTANAIEAFVSHMAIHPLRAFVELVLQADEDPTTMSGEPLPRRKIESALMNIIAAIIDGRFPRNRFGTPGDDEDGAAAEKDEQAPTCKEGSERAGEAHERAVNARRMIAGVRDKSRWQGPFVVNMTAAGDKSIVVREVCGSRRNRERERVLD